MHRVKIKGNRPDFRVFIDLLYGEGRNVDTEGNSIPVNSRCWTYLYIQDRESRDPCVEITACDSDETLFEVASDTPQLEELTALYLFLFCGSDIASANNTLMLEDVQKLSGRYAAQIQRAKGSVWHRSTNEAPYPNLE